MLVGVACIYIFHYTGLTVAGTVSPSLVMMETETEQRAPLHKDVKIILLGVCSAVALCLSLLGVCFCVKRSKSIISDKHYEYSGFHISKNLRCSLDYDIMQSGRWLPFSGRKDYIPTSYGLKVEVAASFEKLAMTCHAT